MNLGFYPPVHLPRPPEDRQGHRAVSDTLDATSTNCPYKAKLALSGDGPTDK